MDHAVNVLAAIIPSRRDLIPHLLHLDEEHFTDPQLRSIFKLIERYFTLTGDVVPRQTLSDLLRRQGSDEAKVLAYDEAYTLLETTPVADHEFKYSIEALQALRAKEQTGELLADAMEILNVGKQVGKEFLLGDEAARMYVLSQTTVIDRMAGDVNATPEGDIRTAFADMRQRYADRKSGKIQAGIPTGLDWLDRNMGGLHNGEFTLVAAYTSQGKTHLCTQMAWHTAVKQGKNVFFGTTETTREQVIRRLVCRHSREPQFGLPEGIDTSAVKDGKLEPNEEAIFWQVLEDLEHNPAYGRINVVQMPNGCTMSMYEAKARRDHQTSPIDLCIADYLTLFDSETKRAKRQEELNDILRHAKNFAVSFADGRGVPFVSPWAITQTKWEEAKRTGGYTLASLSETSEAEKSADNIITMLRDNDQPNEARLQCPKLRDAAVPPPHEVYVDYRNSYLGEKASVEAVNDILDSLVG